MIDRSRPIRYAAGALLLALCLLIDPSTSSAQDSTPSADTLALQRLRPRLGLYGFGGMNLHAGDYTGVPEAPTCLDHDDGSFDGGTGVGFGGGILFELPLTNMFALMLRGGINSLGADESVEVDIGPVNDPTSNVPVPGISAYAFDNSLVVVGADITFGIRPFDFPLTFRIGPELHSAISTSVFQEEEAVSPAGMVYIGANNENTRVRNTYEAPLQNTALRVAGLIGIDYELPMNRNETLLLVPELTYSLAFTDVRTDMSWTASQLRAGLALKFSLPIPRPAPPPEPPVKEPKLAAALDMVSVSSDGVERQDVPIRIEEFINTETRAFLNYIFFEEGESAIPERYIVYLEDARRRFNTAELHNKSKLEVYYQSLNVLGSRMLEYPDSRITLTGTNANVRIEQNNTALSRKRAEAVRDYLVGAWGIDASRIAIEARNLPAVPSNPDSADGIQENRRVEVTSNRIELVAPVTTTDTIRTVDPPILRMRGTQTVEATPGRWKMTLRQGARTLGQFEGEGTPQPAIDFNLIEDEKRIPLTTEPVIATYEQWDAIGRRIVSNDEARVEQVTIQRKREERLGDISYERYNLITFEFDRAVISPVNQLIADIIKGRIRPTSDIEIVGYTDRLGMADHNLELSRNRALSTAEALGVPASKARGAGENTTMFDNDLPEGRFLSRTVDVTVKTRTEAGR